MGCCCCSEEDEFDQRLEGGQPPPRYPQQRRRHSVGSDQAGYPHQQGYQSTQAAGGGGGASGFRTQSAAPRPPPQCQFCGLQFDASLLDGHQETCRAAMRKAAREITVNNGQHVELKTYELDPSIDYDDDKVCVVCMNAMRSYAIVPCGHLIACGGCAKQLETCPMCRQPRAGLLFVDPTSELKTTCKNCKNVIHPAYFDGHREVCALQTRLQQQSQSQSESPASAKPQQSPIETPTKIIIDETLNPADGALVPIELPSTSEQRGEYTPAKGSFNTDPANDNQPHQSGPSPLSSTPPATTNGTHFSPNVSGSKPLSTCIECRTNPIEVALIPCGHSCVCASCGSKITMCPLCFSDVQRVLQTYK